MSSFVISKVEYIKAAGLIYGIESSKRYPHKWFLDNVRKGFVECYEMNVASVEKQYGEKIGFDGCAYDSTFEQYCKGGERIWLGMDRKITDRNEVKNGLMMFFNSVLYQIEEEEMCQKVSSFFFLCATKLFDMEINECEDWWCKVRV